MHLPALVQGAVPLGGWLAYIAGKLGIVQTTAHHRLLMVEVLERQTLFQKMDSQVLKSILTVKIILAPLVPMFMLW